MISTVKAVRVIWDWAEHCAKEHNQKKETKMKKIALVILFLSMSNVAFAIQEWNQSDTSTHQLDSYSDNYERKIHNNYGRSNTLGNRGDQEL